MHLFHSLTRPFGALVGAVVMPFKALFVVALCALINAMTYHGHWWFKWTALGMGIAVLAAFARAAKVLLTLGLVVAAGWWIHRRYGAAARERFDQWAAQGQPRRIVELLRASDAAAAR